MNDNIKKNIYEMLVDRNYTNIIELEDDYIIFICNNKDNKVVVLNNETKIGINDLKKIQLKVKNMNINHVIVITENDITSKAKKSLDKEIKFEFFLYQNLYFNITKHILQPKFKIISEEQVKQIIKTLNCSLNNFPKISINDPISKYYGAELKNVFEIKRKDEIYYRLVV